MKLIFYTVISIFIFKGNAYSQTLKPGFEINEFKQLFLISARTTSNPEIEVLLPPPLNFRKLHSSKSIWLDSYWELWKSNNDSLAVISIRGSTDQEESWLKNFYTAMTPAEGVLTLNNNELFNYSLSKDPKAAIHSGWLLSMAYLSKDILPKIDSLYNSGTHDFLLMGHSQGGAIITLLRAHLNNLQTQGRLPSEITFKTYTSASPKPGNLYFAYEYENITKNGWGFNVVNTEDWVPETPISIQTLEDFNKTNIFSNATRHINDQGLPKKIAYKYLYNKLDKPTKKALKKYNKIFYKRISSRIAKSDTHFSSLKLYNSMNYVRTGYTILLQPDEEYHKLFLDNTSNVFVHHSYKPYLYLIDHYKK